MIVDALISLLAIVVFAVIARKVAVALFESTVLNVICTLFLFCLFSFSFQKVVGPKLAALGKPKVDIETLMSESPVLAAIKEKDLKTFNILRDELKALVKNHPDLRKPETQKKIQHYAIVRGQTMMMRKYLDGADDVAIAEFLKINTRNLAEIRRNSGSEACFYAISPKQGWQPEEGLMAGLSEQRLKDGADAFVKVIRSYNPDRPMPKREEVEPVLRGLAEKIRHVPEPRSLYEAKERAQFCDYTLAFLQALTDNYSPKQIANVMRFNNRNAPDNE